ncbi:uncharacterized protein F4822DRAFT_309802 [Hypoxylon trugodes]|uniref:uncharacterized protein n=1 Tax=Hypoxylon trugodes TaxID=326681 RepID=UPI0021945BD8|nr:uncharacterized protein F4822DRAFT_309802 [Hypoxylon trugodes]KAI1386239.1 hypothetical protein F4822DRAFT_309802 [Hypoxylon trugodes]
MERLLETVPIVDWGGRRLLEAVHTHECCHILRHVPDTGFTTFEDTTEYGISTHIQNELWEREAKRLYDAVVTDAPLQFVGSGNFNSHTKASYQSLATLVDQVWYAMHIALHDGESALARHNPSLHNPRTLKSSRKVLEQCENESNENLVPDLAREDFFNFVEYCTNIIARVLYYAIDADSLRIEILIHLAKITIKLKIVSEKLREYSQMSIDNGYNPPSDPNGPRGKEDHNSEGPDSGFLDDSILKPLRYLQNAADAGGLYSLQCAKYRAGIFQVFRSLINPLRRNNTLQRTNDTSYRIYSTLYETKVDQCYIGIYRDQNSDIMGASYDSRIYYINYLFHILTRTVNGVRDRAPMNDRHFDDPSFDTQILWSHRGSFNGIAAPMTIRHIITIMIPLIMTSPKVIFNIEAVLGMILSTKILVGGRHSSMTRHRAVEFLCLTTEDHNLPHSEHVSRFGHDSDDWNGSRIPREHLAERNITQKMEAWVFEEKGVMVKCKVYVCILMSLCGLLVVGSVVAGVTIGQRISGVDPFNITTYCWALAAFLLLIAKNYRVKDWPWNDFLHGRVLCRSVSELSSITGIDEQLVLTKLLQNESASILNTRGPYNTAFRHKSEDGLSIDRPLSIWNMLLSGLIMVEVETHLGGRGLVSLDLRGGARYGSIQNLGSSNFTSGTEFLHCKELTSPMFDPDYSNRIKLEKGNMSWTRLIGIFPDKYARFEFI